MTFAFRRHGQRLMALALTLGVCGSPAARAQFDQRPPPQIGARVALTAYAFKDLDGRPFDLKRLPGQKASVFVFSNTQCPVANLYSPRILEMSAKYQARGVRFFLVDSNREDNATTLRAYVKQRGFTFPVIKDNGTTLADRLGAHTTPEAIVVDAKGYVVYRGRIDDNVNRAKIIRNDLRDALDETLAGKEVSHGRTPAFGCAIFRDVAPPKVALGVNAVTYTHDIAPILYKNCTSCHRPGENAPFPLTAYQNAKTWSSAIRDYSTRHLMPPWKAAPGYGDFNDARFMSDREIALINKWTAAGCPEGNPKALPGMPKYEDPSAWSLGKPDVVLAPDRPYHLEAEGEDVYRNFVMPIDFKGDRYVSAMEFKPSNRAVVHHIVAFLDLTGEASEKDNKEKEPGFSSNGTVVPTFGSTWGEVWVPGRTARMLPPGVAIKIPKGTQLVMQVHYHKNGAPETDRTQMALYFTKGPVDKALQMWPLGNLNLELKPGDSHVVVTSHLGPLHEDIHLHSIFPHMHLLGKDMKVTAILPDGTKKDLIWINDWDFNWQETYVYKEPVALPKGTTIELTAVFDNSENNPRQPVHPPQLVEFGEETTDEMCFAFLSVTKDNEHLGINAQSASTGR